MEKYICIHGHFYQPPRENPWLEAIEVQDSAYPYHDWNERITVECYAPNAASRILDEEGRIVRIANNYGKISFNIGPTLLAWMEKNSPDVYSAILEADHESRERFSGHGSAMAQAYNHIIMPLANQRDKYTQAAWGIRDFEHRFRRRPEGMWLPETAVDLETLDILAALEIRFTVLSPYQARRIRPLGSEEWTEVEGGRIDPTRAYLQKLPSGRSIMLFFYDGPVSQAIAFEKLLSNGELLVKRLVGAFSDDRKWPQLMHIATDGETYGHHHRHGDMALAYALDAIESQGLAKLTNYGEYLEKHPPEYEVEILENTAWSCAHGVDRWRADCGCHSGGHGDWNQAWRGPVRESLDWLRDELAPRFEETGRTLFRDPWDARNGYVDVILRRSPESMDPFLAQHAAHPFKGTEITTAIKLLELQRHLMLMYTSCGWFFDEISGVETVQCLHYAALGLQVAEELFGVDLESDFLDRLRKAPSNVREFGHGVGVYERLVKPAVVDLQKVCAHYAVSSLFEEYDETTPIYCYDITREEYRVLEAGRVKLGVGRVRVTSNITHESTRLSFGVLHFGDHNLTGGVRDYRRQKAYRSFVQEIEEGFAGADLPQVIRLLDKHFVELTYSLKSLFRDEQRKILDMILSSTLNEAEAGFRHLYDHHGTLMRYLGDLRIPLPGAFQAAAEFLTNMDLRRAFEADPIDIANAQTVLEDAERWRVKLDTAGLAFALKQTLERLAEQFRADPADFTRLQQLHDCVEMTESLPFETDLWKVQNVFYDTLQIARPAVRENAQAGDADAQRWVERFAALGAKLDVRVET